MKIVQRRCDQTMTPLGCAIAANTRRLRLCWLCAHPKVHRDPDCPWVLVVACRRQREALGHYVASRSGHKMRMSMAAATAQEMICTIPRDVSTSSIIAGRDELLHVAATSWRSRSTHRTPARALLAPVSSLEVVNGSRHLPSCVAHGRGPDKQAGLLKRRICHQAPVAS
jgi:hypothetical protein